MPLWEAERIILGASHAEVGAYLLGLWGLPDPLVEALAFHHRPSACPHTVFSPLTAVHAANALAYEGDGPASADASQRLDHDYLLTLGLSGRFTLWREYCETMLAETS
jgi:HD-like signal output (HDOD) protein